MVKAKRAIILAAGLGSRLKEITKDIPKPLINDNGKMMIETIISAFLSIDITDITIVIGYKSEMFNVLKKKYPTINFIFNEYYDTCNNISSMYVARHLLSDCYVCEADLVIQNAKIISSHLDKSCYLGYYTEQTSDWCAKLDSHGNISYFGIGGMEAYETKGISFFTAEDGNKLKLSIEQTWLEKDGKHKLWDDCVFNEHNQNLTMTVKEINKSDVIEIDTIQELAMIDKKYIYLL